MGNASSSQSVEASRVHSVVLLSLACCVRARSEAHHDEGLINRRVRVTGRATGDEGCVCVTALSTYSSQPPLRHFRSKRLEMGVSVRLRPIHLDLRVADPP